MSSPVSQKIQHRASLGVASSFQTPHQQDHIMLDSLSLDGCILPSSHTTTSSSRAILETSLEEDVDVRDDDDDIDDYAPSPLSCLSSILFTSAAAFQQQMKTISPHHDAIMLRDQTRSRRTTSPTTTMGFTIDNKKADHHPMMLDCLSLDGCILPSSSCSSTMTMAANMVMARKKKEL